jgi:hypothetical protein
MSIRKLTREEVRAIASFLHTGNTPEQIVKIFERRGRKITLAQIAYTQRRIERLGADACEV